MTPIDGDTTQFDKRVHYHVGQLLRADDFSAEQNYFLHRDNRHQRTLHGYGTVYGLVVSPHSTSDQPGQIDEIRVSPGVGVDRTGQTFSIRQTQCADDIAVWWNDKKKPGVIYVVAKYAEIDTDRVLRAGQPCEDDVQEGIYSRKQDSVTLELWDHKPEMPLFAATRCMQQLLLRVHLAETGNAKDKAGLLDACQKIRVCDQTSWQAEYRITIRDLDEVLTLWITQVLPDLHTADQQAANDYPWVLLGEVHVDRAKSNDAPLLLNRQPPPDTYPRPLLLHTQLLLPLLASQARNGATTTVPVMPFVSVMPQFDQKTRELALELWFHLDTISAEQSTRFTKAPEIVVLAEAADKSKPKVLSFSKGEEGPSNVYTYRLEHDSEATGVALAYLRIIIPTSAKLRKGQTFPTLDEYMRENDFRFEGYRPGEDAIVVYARTLIPVKPGNIE